MITRLDGLLFGLGTPVVALRLPGALLCGICMGVGGFDSRPERRGIAEEVGKSIDVHAAAFLRRVARASKLLCQTLTTAAIEELQFLAPK